ncbi:hypothetical protein ACT29H_02785 [Thermophagus sp. OGC60D27]|uniref:hypothetical protein n=1 Tax=Thermophagus sp. OGC60D27 TaxID=3458415 RepID=UPI0040377D64
MKDKYRGKYRNKSMRLQNWDYSWNAACFVTICTHQRRCFFGEVVSGKMKLSPVGIIADILWHEIKNHAQNVELGAYVVMPNHVHGILILPGNPDFTNTSFGTKNHSKIFPIISSTTRQNGEMTEC